MSACRLPLEHASSRCRSKVAIGRQDNGCDVPSRGHCATTGREPGNVYSFYLSGRMLEKDDSRVVRKRAG